MGVPVVVENRPGAGGNVGAAVVAKGEASGHSVLMAPSAILATNQWLYKEMAYNPQKDLTPVVNAATTPNLWVAHPQLPAKSIAEVIALARSKPGALSFASGGAGAIAVTALKRHAQAPDVPTANESGLPGFEVSVWYGFAVAAATPRNVVDKLNGEIARALRHPVVAERLDSLGLTIVADTPEEFARFVAAESDKMRKLVQASGARVD